MRTADWMNAYCDVAVAWVERGETRAVPAMEDAYEQWAGTPIGDATADSLASFARQLQVPDEPVDESTVAPEVSYG